MDKVEAGFFALLGVLFLVLIMLVGFGAWWVWVNYSYWQNQDGKPEAVRVYTVNVTEKHIYTTTTWVMVGKMIVPISNTHHEIHLSDGTKDEVSWSLYSKVQVGDVVTVRYYYLRPDPMDKYDHIYPRGSPWMVIPMDMR